MKEISSYEVKEFVYDSEEERNEHVEMMSKNDWIVGGQIRRLNPEVSVMDATKNDHEWYAKFERVALWLK